MTSSEEDEGPPANGSPTAAEALRAQVNGNANDAVPLDVDLTAQPADRDAAQVPAPVQAHVDDKQPDNAPVATSDATLAAVAVDSQNASPLAADLPSVSIDPSIAPVYPQPEIDLMMTLAQMSAGRLEQPPTVTPAHVSLQETLLHGGADGLDHANGPLAGTNGGPGLESFARIEFADSTFQMTTYAVIIGRDQRALEQARRDEKREQDYQRRVQENAANGLPPPSPPSQDRGKFSKSYVSEEGGMLGPESDGGPEGRPAKRRKTSNGARSASGTPYQAEQVQQLPQGFPDKNANVISNRQYVSHTPGAAAVDLASLRPSPYHIPHIGIHSPGPNIASRTKAISREHLKIEFNQERGVFEAIPMHKNGFFCDDVHYRDTKVVLKSGDRLQIKDVDFAFMINGVAQGKTGAEEYLDEEETSSKRYSEGGKEMSFEFESSHGGEMMNTTEESSEVEIIEEDMEEEEEDEEEDEELVEDEVMESIEDDGIDAAVDEELEQDEELPPPPPPKKRGPGRPPKNGIRSKREERLLKKQAMEEARKSMPQPPPTEQPIKRKVGRPRKHPLPEGAEDRPEKRKYKPRKPKDAEGSDGEKAVKEKKREKPKTPPLELRREDFTEEQLLKPTKNYSLLIDEVLTAALPGGLTLKQIYKRIQKKYPYYYFTVDTKGWESSVRHNLIGNDAFKKEEETHLWFRVPGIELEAGKKRKAPSPDRQAGGVLHGTGHNYAAHGPIYRPAQTQGMNPAIQPGYSAVNGSQYSGVTAYQAFRPGLTGPVGLQAPGRLQNPMVAPSQANGVGPAAAGPSRPYQPANTMLPYSSPFMSSTKSQQPTPGTLPPAPPGAHGSAGHQQPGTLQRQPALSSAPVNGVSHAGGPTSVRPNQPHVQTNGNANALFKPPIDSAMADRIAKFQVHVVQTLQQRNTPKAELIALSAINRGIGLATRSPVPELNSMESVILGVFQQSLRAHTAATDPTKGAQMPPQAPSAEAQVLQPELLQVLLKFKADMMGALNTKLGELPAEALLLSAMDRVLGFSDKSSTQPADDKERKELATAEDMLIIAIRKKIIEFQRQQPR
jgi:hypothetical protein